MPSATGRLAAAAATVALLVSLGAPGASAAGLLLPKGGGAPLALKHNRVNITAKDGTAVTRVEQVFVNQTGRQLEATFLFPLPTDAVLIDFKLLVNGTMKKGEVLPRDQAERIYLDIVRSMKDPGLIDWMDKNLFRARIFPVPAHGEQRIEVTYTQVLPFMDGTYKLTHPLATPGAVSTTLEDFTLTARLAHKTGLKAIYSPTHRVSVQRKGDHEATIGFEGNRVPLDKDFALYFGVSDDPVGPQVLTYKPDADPGYFMLLAAPKVVFRANERPRKAITFVLDTSGSMAGSKMEQARRALRWCLDQLDSDDRFNVVRFSSDVETYSRDLVSATSKNLDGAREFVRGFEAAGGTAIDAALETALHQDVDDGETHLVVFITDGRPTVGETATDKIVARSDGFDKGSKARLFAFGVGDDVDAKLLDRLADGHGGTSAYLGATDDLEVQIGGLYTQLAHPVLTDLALDVRNVRTFATLPGKTLPDLFKGSQLVVVGRYRGDGDALIRLTGTMQGERRTFDFEATLPARRDDNAFLAPIWANRQVGVLLDQIRLHGETAALKQEVVQLATRFGIVTPFTSYLVVEDDAAIGRDPRPPRPIRPTFGRPSPASRAPAPNLDGDMGGEAEETMRDAFRKRAKAGAAQGSGGGGFGRSSSGKQAVRDAKAVKHLKAKKRAESDVAEIRYVAGRAMRFVHGRWQDQAYRAGMETIRVAPYSKAWLQVVKIRPELSKALSLGDRVLVVVAGVAVEVEPGAPAKLSAKHAARLRR